MKTLAHTLTTLYALAALALLGCALHAHQAGAHGYVALFTTTAAVLAVGIVHTAWHHEQLRAALTALERAARPPDQRPGLEDGVVAVALAAACCERWWTSAGAEHDTAHCTRKDQTL
ncbi:hypothetical protein [Streptomyces coelicoflavus]|uniref:hypothetical protein n=1 Tax=Streptomyces coelicoflavus TaxID=285562 RepID=UPI003629B611